MTLNISNATFIIIGEAEDCAGLIDSSTDEFSAHKIAKQYKKEGYKNIKVLPHNELSLQEASNLMQSFIKKKWP